MSNAAIFCELYLLLVADLHHCQSHLVLVPMAIRIATRRRHLLHFDCRILVLKAMRLESDVLDDCLLSRAQLHHDY